MNERHSIDGVTKINGVVEFRKSPPPVSESPDWSSIFSNFLEEGPNGPKWCLWILLILIFLSYYNGPYFETNDAQAKKDKPERVTGVLGDTLSNDSDSIYTLLMKSPETFHNLKNKALFGTLDCDAVFRLRDFLEHTSEGSALNSDEIRLLRKRLQACLSAPDNGGLNQENKNLKELYVSGDEEMALMMMTDSFQCEGFRKQLQERAPLQIDFDVLEGLAKTVSVFEEHNGLVGIPIHVRPQKSKDLVQSLFQTFGSEEQGELFERMHDIVCLPRVVDRLSIIFQFNSIFIESDEDVKHLSKVAPYLQVEDYIKIDFSVLSQESIESVYDILSKLNRMGATLRLTGLPGGPEDQFIILEKILSSAYRSNENEQLFGLEIPGNALNRLPDNLFDLHKNIYLLNVSNNTFTQIPEEIQGLNNLYDLNVSKNPIDTLPGFLEGQLNLEEINIKGTNIEDVSVLRMLYDNEDSELGTVRADERDDQSVDDFIFLQNKVKPYEDNFF